MKEVHRARYGKTYSEHTTLPNLHMFTNPEALQSSPFGLFMVVSYVCVCVLVAQSCPTFCDPINCSLKVSLSMEFSRQEYWSG